MDTSPSWGGVAAKFARAEDETVLPTSMYSPSNELVAPVTLCGTHGCKAHKLALLGELCGPRSDLLLLNIHNLHASAADRLVPSDVTGRI